MNWNPQQHEDYDMLKGFDVYSNDNEKLGTIKEIYHPQEEMTTARGRHYFRVEPGMIEGTFKGMDEVYVPERLVQTVNQDNDQVILEVSKQDVDQHDWGRPTELDDFRPS